MEDYFLIEVRIPYQIDELLTIEKGDEFSVKYEEISELRESFNICYKQINFIQKQEFVDFIEGGLISLRMDINSQKKVVKQMSKKVRKLKEDKPDLVIIDAQNSLYQNEELLSCLQEQDVFLRNWLEEKRKEILVLRKKENEEYKSRLIKEFRLKNDIPERSENLKTLKEIWLPEPKISLEDFLNKGIEIGIWDNDYLIITKRGSLYGTGKIMLGSLSVALKGWAISNHLDHKNIGCAFCEFFNLEFKPNVKNRYKSFEVGNPKYISEFKRAFNIRL